jgi:hypothetical protein
MDSRAPKNCDFLIVLACPIQGRNTTGSDNPDVDVIVNGFKHQWSDLRQINQSTIITQKTKEDFWRVASVSGEKAKVNPVNIYHQRSERSQMAAFTHAPNKK